VLEKNSNANNTVRRNSADINIVYLTHFSR